jgi:WD40 repeat protein/class 3 adenylate cyclase/tRNA A-37 threonylcarbamoyl transferase component Bud32
MTPEAAAPQSEQVAAFFQKHRTGLVTLVFTDVVDSVALLSRLGDQAGATFMQRRRQVIREVLQGLHEGAEIETAGDSFLLAFAKPSDGVRFALQSQARLRRFSTDSKVPVQERIGIHLGEVVIAENETASKAKDFYGIQLATCFRVMSLAAGGQVLLTRGAFDSARQVLKGEDLPGVGGLQWVSHGPYLLKGIEEPVEVCEVGETGQSLLSAPKTSEKAQRQVRPDEEPVLGWRPAVGQDVPNTPWVLEEKLGEGGFGEVWVAQHPKLKERRVFKFCFRADRVRALKREMTLFRLLKEHVGDHPNIVRLHEVYLEVPPFYLEEEYVEGKDLKTWCEAQGGVEEVPVEMRLEIVAQAAEALQAAHDAGIIHRDVKPGNILVSGGLSGGKPPVVKLTDFGIGQVISAEYLKGVTQAGFTQTMLGSTSSGTGTTMYLAPEIIAGQPATTRSDIYSLGVVLWQLVAGDLKRPVTTDWAKGVADSLLREDLERCFAGDPGNRFAGAGQLAKSLRARENRIAELVRLRLEQAERERMRQQAERRQRLLLASGIAVLVLVALTTALLYGLRRAHQEARQAQLNAYAADMKAAQVALQRNNLGLGIELLDRYRPKPGAEDLRGLEWRYLWQAARGDELHTWTQPSMVTGARFSPDGIHVVSSGIDGFLRVWDLVARKPQPVALIDRGVRDDDALVSFCFSPDGRTLASAHREGALVLFDTRTWQPVHKVLLPIEDRSALIAHGCLCYSPDGRWLAARLRDVLRIWDTRNYEMKRLPTQSRWRIAFAPDSRTLAVCEEDCIALLDLSTGKRTLELRGLPIPVQLAFSPRGNWIAASNWDGRVQVWDLVTGHAVWTNAAHVARVNGLAFSKDGDWLVTAGYDQLIRIWQVATQQKVRTLRGHLNEIWSLDFSPDGRLLITSSKDGSVKLWDPRSEPRRTQWGLEPDERFLGFGTQGHRFVTMAKNRTSLRHWNGVRLLKTVPLEPPGLPEEPLGPLFCPGSRNLLTGNTNGTIYVRSAESSEVVRSLSLAVDLNQLTMISPDERWLAVEGGPEMGGPPLCVCDCQSGEVVARFPEWGWPHHVLDFSPDGHFIALGTTNYSFKVWDLRSRRLAFTLSGHVWHALSLGFSADSRFLATGSWDGDARVWDLTTGRQVAGPFRGHGSGVDAVCFSPDARTLVTSGSDFSVRMWHVPTGREMVVLDQVDRGGGIRFLSPSGQLMAFRATALNVLRLESIPAPEEVNAVDRTQR